MAKKNHVQDRQDFPEDGNKQLWKFTATVVGTFVLLAAIAASAQQAKQDPLLKPRQKMPSQNLLKGNVLKQGDAKPNKDLVDLYGESANDPAVADLLRKAQGTRLNNDEMKAKIEADEALQNGVWKPGADPTMALMYGFVPPNMSPEQAAIMAENLPKLPRMPQALSPEQMAGEPEDRMTIIDPMSPYIPYPESFAKAKGLPATRRLQMIPQQRTPNRMAGMPGVPYVPGMPLMGFGSGLQYGLSKAEIAEQNQKSAEECLRARYGPINVQPIQRDPEWLAQHTKKTATGYILENDHQSTVGVCDASGNEITSIEYDPWGNQTVLHGGTVMPDVGFQGMYMHQPSGLYLTLFRAYSPKLGRWLSRDPIGESAGTNRYAYVGNNPISRRDPLGLYVMGTYSQSSHEFTAYDTDFAGPTFSSTDIFSGNGMFADNSFFQAAGGRGPIPQGEYFIEPKIPIPGEANFEYPLNSLSQGMETFMGLPWTRRGGFAIHPGNRSNGCITFKSNVPEEAENYPSNKAFDALSNMLDRTNPLNVNGVPVRGILRVLP